MIIPKDFATRNDWLNLLCLPPTTSNRVCSKHFNPLDFVVKDDGHIWLKKNAYPFPVIITPEPFENEVEVEYTPLKYASNVVSVNLNRMYEEHNYVKLNPTKLHNVVSVRYNNRCQVMSLRKSLRRLRNRMKEANKGYKNAMRKFSNFTNLSPLLQELFLLLMKHHKSSSAPKEYSPEIRKFALSLHYYSPAGYQFLSICADAVIHLLSEEDLARLDDCEDHGYDDVTEDIDLNCPEDIHSANSEINVDTAMDSVFFNDAEDPRYDYDSEEEQIDPLIDDEHMNERPDVDEDEGIRDDFDLGQIEDIAKKYYNLIKQKDRGGLFYPSDSLYRIAIVADLVFIAAVKDSGKKMLTRKFTFDRLVGSAKILCDKYSTVLFSDLKEHFVIVDDHEDSLIKNILKFYLRIRIDFLNKGLSANSGKRQQMLINKKSPAAALTFDKRK
ncbi:hypothetical protein Bhyg_07829, partial [Pseudolycoriella hygida]